jgi:RNase P subunit RPR2
MVTVVGKDETKVKRVTCRSCASILEYNLSEVKEYHGTDYGGGPDGQEWVDCPHCGKRAVIRSW